MAITVSDINLNHLPIFKTVVESKSFSKAGALLNAPKSKVSRTIALLENELGVRLIYRTTRQFQLTNAGQELYHLTQRWASELEASFARLNSTTQEISGRLRISGPRDLGSALLGPICHEFIQAHPKMSFECLFSNEYLDLVQNSIDIGIRVGSLSDSSMIQRKPGEVRLILAGHSKFSHIDHPEALKTVPFVAFSEITSHGPLLLRSERRKVSADITPVLVSDDFIFNRAAVVEGVGVGIFPAFLIQQELKSGDLIPILSDWDAGSSPVHVLMPRHKEPSVVHKVFVDFLVQRLRAALTV